MPGRWYMVEAYIQYRILKYKQLSSESISFICTFIIETNIQTNYRLIKNLTKTTRNQIQAIY